ncbi:leucine rich repeat LRR-containing protein [Nitzschia inconspicua]|uniref:Leucine rich repeat LRR-containing protein n=1 Tax=Nitzschia inconspicua TaxID=303405 RepID=A0A9K3LUL6_9STRA|nr:leucine rich repeat LRR-containing protein [Nitzschia inconspicua]
MESHCSELPFRRRIDSCHDRIKTTIIGGSPSRSRTFSPRSVAELPGNRVIEEQAALSCRINSKSIPSVVGTKRKFPFDASFAIVPTIVPCIPSPLPSSSNSTSVNLRHRLVCDEMVEWLATQSCSKTNPPVSELWLGPVFESSATVLSAIATLPSTVTHLDLDLRNALHLVPQAMPLLMSKQHLKSLSVRVFGDSGAIDLARELHRNPHLEQLDVRGNRIGSFGTRALVKAVIASENSLSKLFLSCNCILDGDMIGLLLSCTQQLQSLDLAFNWLGDEGVEHICEGLCKNKSLQELNLYGCHRISNAGLRTILDCVQYYNTSLHEIRLQTFDEEGEGLVRRINHFLALNKAGRYLVQSNNPVPESLWPLVLAKSNQTPDSLFYLIREAIGPSKAGKTNRTQRDARM